MAELLFLGTGSSLGVPLVGCACQTCTSSSLLNKRMRPSALITVGGKQFLIDAGPDFRFQALTHNIHQLDGVLLTHAHQDHVAGLDDLRPLLFKRKEPLPILLSIKTAKDIQNRFHYFFKKEKPPFDFHLLPEASEGAVVFQGLPLYYLTYEQANMEVNGFRIGNFAYISDIRVYQESIFSQLRGVETLIISALRLTSSRLHFSVDEAVEFASKLGVKKAWLTHISHDLEHEKINAYLPSFVQLAYDGLSLQFNETRPL
jgi:phosphoribosyl 1,2-cyclic phosphate phosphodiesterase